MKIKLSEIRSMIKEEIINKRKLNEDNTSEFYNQMKKMSGHELYKKYSDAYSLLDALYFLLKEKHSS